MNLIIPLGVGMFLKSKNPQIKVVLADPQVNRLNSWLVLLPAIQKKTASDKTLQWRPGIEGFGVLRNADLHTWSSCFGPESVQFRLL